MPVVSALCSRYNPLLISSFPDKGDWGYMFTDLILHNGQAGIGGSQFEIVTTEDSGKQTRILVDFGLDFALTGKFWDFSFKWRQLRHLIRVGALPNRPEFYREDLLEEPVDGPRPDAFILTHAHLDHIGGAFSLHESIPWYTSPITATWIRLQDEVKYRQLEYSFNTFRKNVPGLSPTKRPIIERDIRAISPGIPFNVGPMKITLHAVDHSMIGACAVEVETENGRIVYTGDLRFDGRRVQQSEEFLEKVQGCDILLIEGTNIDEERGLGEDGVRTEMIEAMKTIPDKLTIFFIGYNDFERLQTAAEAAQAVGRKLVVYKRVAYMMDRIRSVFPEMKSLEELGILTYSENGDESDGTTKTLREWQTPVVSAAEIRANPGQYAVVTHYFGQNIYFDIEPPAGSLRINARCEPFNDDMELDADRASNWDGLFGLKFLQIHTSGHAARPDLQRAIAAIAPKRVIPVHTLNPRAFAEITDRPLLFPARGERIRL